MKANVVRLDAQKAAGSATFRVAEPVTTRYDDFAVELVDVGVGVGTGVGVGDIIAV